MLAFYRMENHISLQPSDWTVFVGVIALCFRIFQRGKIQQNAFASKITFNQCIRQYVTANQNQLSLFYRTRETILEYASPAITCHSVLYRFKPVYHHFKQNSFYHSLRLQIRITVATFLVCYTYAENFFMMCC